MGKLVFSKIAQDDKFKMVKGLRVFLSKDSLAKYMMLYSKSKGGKKWMNDERKAVTLGFFKTCEDLYTARALVIGKHKFSLIVGNLGE